MLQARSVAAKQIEAQTKPAQGSRGMAIVPLAIPLTAGPGGISLMIVAAGSTRGIFQDTAAISSVLIVSISIFVLFRSAERIAVVFGQTA